MDLGTLPTLRQLQYLVTLSETRNFRKAAELLEITQPSLSVQLKTLEDTLGVVLAERGRGGVILTPMGRTVSDMAVRILADVRTIVDITAVGGSGLGGTLRLGAPPTLAPYLLPPVIKKLHKTYPELKLYVREESPRDLQNSLLSGKYDLVLTPLPVGSSDVEVDRLFREPLYFVCATDHPLAGETEVAPRDLYGEQILTLEQQHLLHDQIRNLSIDLKADLLRDYEATSLDTLRHMVGTGLGVSFLPALYVHSEIGARGEVTVATIKGKNVSRTIGLAWRKGHANADAYHEMSDTVRSVVRAKFKDITVL